MGSGFANSYKEVSGKEENREIKKSVTQKREKPGMHRPLQNVA